MSTTHHVAFVCIFNKQLLNYATTRLKDALSTWLVKNDANRVYSVLADVFQLDGQDPVHAKKFATPFNVDEFGLPKNNQFVLPVLRNQRFKVANDASKFAHLPAISCACSQVSAGKGLQFRDGLRYFVDVAGLVDRTSPSP